MIRLRKSFVDGQESNLQESSNSYHYGPKSNNNISYLSHNANSYNNPKNTIANHNSQDQLISLQGSINRTYTYTQDGEVETMTNCHGTVNYEYDSFGNLKKVTLADGKVVEYKIDGLNRRIKKLVNG